MNSITGPPGLPGDSGTEHRPFSMCDCMEHSGTCPASENIGTQHGHFMAGIVHFWIRCQKNNSYFWWVHVICNEIKWGLQLSLPYQRFIDLNPTRIRSRIWECNKMDAFFIFFPLVLVDTKFFKKTSTCLHFPCWFVIFVVTPVLLFRIVASTLPRSRARIAGLSAGLCPLPCRCCHQLPNSLPQLQIWP